MKKIIALLFLVTFVFAGCTVHTHYSLTNRQLNRSNPYRIKVYAGTPSGMKYTVLGLVAVDTPGKGEKAMDKLKNEASYLGANAIINVQLTKLNSFASRTGMSGVAVLVEKNNKPADQ